MEGPSLLRKRKNDPALYMGRGTGRSNLFIAALNFLHPENMRVPTKLS
jgi:hypothetical protein